MKHKALAALLASVMTVGILSGCGMGSDSGSNTSDKENSQEASTEEPVR